MFARPFSLALLGLALTSRSAVAQPPLPYRGELPRYLEDYRQQQVKRYQFMREHVKDYIAFLERVAATAPSPEDARYFRKSAEEYRQLLKQLDADYEELWGNTSARAVAPAPRPVKR